MAGYRIAVLPGDGIGKEVVPEGIRVLESVGHRFDIQFTWDIFTWNCETFTQTGRMMPEDGIDQLREYDAIFLGAVGFPTVPDHISLWGLLIPIRRQMQQYVNLRPIRMLRGMVSPLQGRGPAVIDFLVVRESNEGEYSEIGGRLYSGSDQEMVVQETVFTKKGVDRALK
jgi:tartrate dehydrogenase/decarboxylase/D-malate dehydrogenase